MNNLLELLERAAYRWPQHIAFADTVQSLTYSQLWLRVCRLSSRLQQRFCGMLDQPVAVCSRRSVDTVAACLAVLGSGNFYIPIDLDQPPLRLRSMLTKSHPLAILAEPDFQAEWTEDMEVLDWQDRFEDDGPAPAPIYRARSAPAYAIFTSGSTGQPKCVLKSHGSMLSFVESFSRLFALSEHDVFANQSPFDLDVSAKDIYIGLATGSTVHIMPRELFSQPQKLIDSLIEQKITTLIWSSSAVSLLAAWDSFSYKVPETIRQVFFSGEVMPGRDILRWRQALPAARLVNLYAPTEVTGNCLYYEAPQQIDSKKTLPLGVPFPEMEVSLRDESLRLVEDGTIGELCISGPFLSTGYLHDTTHTAMVFLKHPDYPDQIIYRSGDLACREADGQLMFRGRRDGQIKHNGHRIELSEIEAALNALTEAPPGCCLYDATEKKICLVYQADTDCTRTLASALADVLPKYMRPNKYVRLPALPCTRSGKPDRAFLTREYCHG